MIGFLVFWLINSSIVAVVAGFRSGEMSLGQWLIALAGGLVLNFLEARLFALLFGERTPIFDPTTGRVIGGYRSTKGLLAAAREPVNGYSAAAAASDPVRQQRDPRPGASNNGLAGTRNSAADASKGPWSAENVDRDAGLFLRAVIYSMESPSAPASARAYATAIGECVVTGNEKTLLVLLTGLTNFVAKVHFLRDDPFDDPGYLPYSRLLTVHFMSAASQAMPGRNAPPEAVRRANVARLAAEASEPSMALVEALGIVGSAAIESLSTDGR